MSTLNRDKNEEQLEVEMKKWILFSVLVFLLIIFMSCQKQLDEGVAKSQEKLQAEKIAPIALSLEDVIDTAVMNFQNGEMTEGVSLLLDGILLVKPKERWPDGFVATLSTAKEQFQKGNLPDFGKSISDSLLLIQPVHVDSEEEAADSSNTQFQKPQEAKPAPIALIFTNMLSTAMDEFKKGDADCGVIKILQALQLMTPLTK